MGYDMYMVSPKQEYTDCLQRWRDEFDRLCEVRDAIPKSAEGTYKHGKGVEVTPTGGSDAWRKAAQDVLTHFGKRQQRGEIKPDYRLSIWGMGNVREIFRSLGLGYFAAYEEKFPPYPGEEHIDDTGDASVGIADIGREYIAKRDEILRYREQGVRGINLNKFCSNDGWLVTPEECSDVAELYGQLKANGHQFDAEHDYVERFIEWIIAAKDCGGFRVC